MASLFLPFAQEIASEREEEKSFLVFFLGSRNHTSKKGARVYFGVGRKLEEEEL